MKRILWMTMAIGLSLAAIAAIIYPCSDGEILVPPPEAVAEGFVRALETGRFSRGLPYLVENLRAPTSSEGLKQWISDLEHESGKIQDVKGRKSSMGAETAEAWVLIRTPQGRRELRFRLRREHALWKIAQLPEESK